MNTITHNGTFTLILSFVITIVITLLPLPEFLVWWRPNWVLMVLIYWTMAMPHRIGIIAGWALGLLMDVTIGSVLGLHGFSYAIITYLIIVLAPRMRLFLLWQQSVIIGLMVGFDLVLSLWIQNFMDPIPRQATYWLPMISSTVIWPLVFILLRWVRRHFNVR